MASRLMMKMFCAELKLFWKYSLRTQSVICKFWLLIDWTSQKSTASQKEEIICDSVTAKVFERRASCWSSYWPRTQRSNSVDLGTSSNEIKSVLNTNLLPKFTFVKTRFLCVFWMHLWSLLSLARWSNVALESVNLPDKTRITFAKRFALVLFK